MNVNAFYDTNILIYLYSIDEPEKREQATKIIAGPNGWVSTQVLSELCNILGKKFQMQPLQIRAVVNEITQNFEVTAVTAETINSALSLSERYKYSYFDSLIIAAALEQHCTILYSEDMQHGQVIETTKIVNPFRKL